MEKKGLLLALVFLGFIFLAQSAMAQDANETGITIEDSGIVIDETPATEPAAEVAEQLQEQAAEQPSEADETPTAETAAEQPAQEAVTLFVDPALTPETAADKTANAKPADEPAGDESESTAEKTTTESASPTEETTTDTDFVTNNSIAAIVPEDLNILSEASGNVSGNADSNRTLLVDAPPQIFFVAENATNETGNSTDGLITPLTAVPLVVETDTSVPVIGNGTETLMLSDEEPGLIDITANLTTFGRYVGDNGFVLAETLVNATGENIGKFILAVNQDLIIVGNNNNITLKTTYLVDSVKYFDLTENQNVTLIGENNKVFFIRVYEVTAEVENVTVNRKVYEVIPVTPEEAESISVSFSGNTGGTSEVSGNSQLSTENQQSFITEIGNVTVDGKPVWKIEIHNWQGGVKVNANGSYSTDPEANVPLNLTNAKIEYGLTHKKTLVVLNETLNSGEAKVFPANDNLPSGITTVRLINATGVILSQVTVDFGWYWEYTARNMGKCPCNVSWQFANGDWGWAEETIGKPNE